MASARMMLRFRPPIAAAARAPRPLRLAGPLPPHRGLCAATPATPRDPTGSSRGVDPPRGVDPVRATPGATEWEGMSAEQQDAAGALGWSPESWRDGMHVIPLSAKMSSAERAAIEALGHTAESWDAIPRAWAAAEPVEATDDGAGWRGDGSAREEAGGSGGAAGDGGARPFVLRLLAAALGGAALCIAAEEAGLLPEAQAQGGEKGDETSDQ